MAIIIATGETCKRSYIDSLAIGYRFLPVASYCDSFSEELVRKAREATLKPLKIGHLAFAFGANI